MTNSKKSKIAECISKLAEEICNVYEGEEDKEEKEPAVEPAETRACDESNSSNINRFEKMFDKLTEFEDWFDGTFKWKEWDEEKVDSLDAPIVNSICSEIEKSAAAFQQALIRMIDHIGKDEETDESRFVESDGEAQDKGQLGEAAVNNHIKAVSFGWDGDPVPVSEFKSAADLLEAIYDASQAALNDGYYASLQIDFDQFDDDSDEDALVAEIRPIED